MYIHIVFAIFFQRRWPYMFYWPSQSQSHRLLIIHQVSKKPEKILSLSQEATTEFKYPVIYNKPHLQVQNDRPGTPHVWHHTGDFKERLYPVTRPKIMICPVRIVYRCAMFFTCSLEKLYVQSTATAAVRNETFRNFVSRVFSISSRVTPF